MITLCLDTSYNHLVIALYQNDKLMDCYEEVCERNQSERIFPELIALFEKNNLKNEDINQIVISKGPGSYTGVRIAMTIAKIIGSLRKIPVYTISTLQLYKVNNASIMDAKGGKVFIGRSQDEILPLEEVLKIKKQYQWSGDVHLLDLNPVHFSISKQFIKKKSDWELVEDIDALVPQYLKEAI